METLNTTIDQLVFRLFFFSVRFCSAHIGFVGMVWSFDLERSLVVFFFCFVFFFNFTRSLPLDFRNTINGHYIIMYRGIILVSIWSVENICVLKIKKKKMHIEIVLYNSFLLEVVTVVGGIRISFNLGQYFIHSR